MKKKTFKMMAILWVGLFLASPVWAACQGTSVTGKDGYVYCKSRIKTNWWSAFAWCDAQGKKLISLNKCNGINGDVTGTVACPNFPTIAGGRHWTTSVYTDGVSSYYIDSSGAVGAQARTSEGFAFCE